MSEKQKLQQQVDELQKTLDLLKQKLADSPELKEQIPESFEIITWNEFTNLRIII